MSPSTAATVEFGDRDCLSKSNAIPAAVKAATTLAVPGAESSKIVTLTPVFRKRGPVTVPFELTTLRGGVEFIIGTSEDA
jgi:hypothetical protein